MQLPDRRVRNFGFAGKVVGPGQQRLARESLEENFRRRRTRRMIGKAELGAPFRRQGLLRIAQLHRRSPPPGRGGRPLLLGNGTPAGIFADHAFKLKSRRRMHPVS